MVVSWLAALLNKESISLCYVPYALYSTIVTTLRTRMVRYHHTPYHTSLLTRHSLSSKWLGTLEPEPERRSAHFREKGGGEDEIFCNNVCSRAHILTRRKTGIDRIHDKKATHPNKTQPRQTDSKRIVIDQTIILKLFLSSLSSFSSI